MFAKLFRPLSLLIWFQAALCGLATYLVSKISLIGKIGIALFYKEYKIFRNGWKTFLLFFGIQLLIILLLYLTQKRSPPRKTVFTAIVFLIIAVIGLLFSFIDFQYTYSHRLLKERFHLGFYLFWIGWMISCAYFIIHNRRRKVYLLEEYTEEREPSVWFYQNSDN